MGRVVGFPAGLVGSAFSASFLPESYDGNGKTHLSIGLYAGGIWTLMAAATPFHSATDSRRITVH